jgi:hypothetical protein
MAASTRSIGYCIDRARPSMGRLAAARHGWAADKACWEVDAATLTARTRYSPRSAANRAGFLFGAFPADPH